MTPKEVEIAYSNFKKAEEKLIAGVISDITVIVKNNGGLINFEEEEEEYSFDVIGYEGLGYLADAVKVDENDGTLVVVDDTKEEWYIGDVDEKSIIELHAYLYRIGMATRPVSQKANNVNA